MTTSADSAAKASLWRHRNFRTFLIGQSANVAGSSVSSMVIPVLAVVELNATPGQVAWLAFLGLLPPALLALHAGALADRHSKRHQMIIGDLVSAAALTTIPVAAALEALSMPQLMAVAVVQGAAGVVHDAAAISILPSLVDRSLIQRSNSRVGALFAVSATGGSNLGAALTALTGPARAVLADVLSYLVSAWCTARIHTPTTAPPAKQTRLWEEIGDGLKYVWGDARLATLTLVNATMSFALALMNTLWALYLLRNLAMSTTVFGVVLGLGALGAAGGATLAPRLARRFGPGPMMLGALALTPLTQIPLLAASPGPRWNIIIGSALTVQLACAAAAGTTQRSIRQIITDSPMQARMQAASTWLTAGTRPFGALLAGGLGTWAGVRTSLIIGACLLVVPFLVLVLSPMRRLRQMPQGPDAPPWSAGPGKADTAGSRAQDRTIPGTAAAPDVACETSTDGATS